MTAVLLVLLVVAAGVLTVLRPAEREVSYRRSTPEPPRLRLVEGGRRPFDWAEDEAS